MVEENSGASSSLTVLPMTTTAAHYVCRQCSLLLHDVMPMYPISLTFQPSSKGSKEQRLLLALSEIAQDLGSECSGSEYIDALDYISNIHEKNNHSTSLHSPNSPNSHGTKVSPSSTVVVPLVVPLEEGETFVP